MKMRCKNRNERLLVPLLISMIIEAIAAGSASEFQEHSIVVAGSQRSGQRKPKDLKVRVASASEKGLTISHIGDDDLRIGEDDIAVHVKR